MVFKNYENNEQFHENHFIDRSLHLNQRKNISGRDKIVEMLLDKKAELDIKDENGQSAMDIAVPKGKLKCKYTEKSQIMINHLLKRLH